MAKSIIIGNNKSYVKNYSRMLVKQTCSAKTSNMFILKCVFLGSSGVGKSCLIERFMNNTFDDESKSTMGVAFNTKYFSIDDKTIKLDVWDTAGQERYNSIMPLYYRGAGVVIIVFQIGNNASFNRAKKWVEEIKNCEFYDKNQVILLLGNKYDGDVEGYDLKKYVYYANYNNIMFNHCSAKTGLNVSESISNIIHSYIEKTNMFKVDKEETAEIDDFNINYELKTKHCCY